MGSVEKGAGAPMASAQTAPVAPDADSQTAGSGPSGSRGLTGQVPPPFLTKLYDLVDDPKTNELVSWSPDGHIFTVHRPTEFEREVLPKYFKHNNFSSFVRQLNQYGFHKQDPDNWTFGQDNFRRGRRDLLVEISRKKSKNQVQAPPNSNMVQVVPGRDGQLGNQKYVLELGNYGVYNEVERLQRDRDVLFNELMMARKQLGLSRKQENQLKQKCDLNERRIEQLENNMKKMQQFLFYYFRPVLKNYGKSKRKRLTAPTATNGPDMESSSSPGVAAGQADPSLTTMMDGMADGTTGFTPILTNSGPMAADGIATAPMGPVAQPGTTFPTAVVHELSSDNSAAVDPGDWNGTSAYAQPPNGKRRRVAQEAAARQKADTTRSDMLNLVNQPIRDESDFPPTAENSSSGRTVYHQPTENGFETVFFDGSAPSDWNRDDGVVDGASGEPMMDELLDMDNADSLNFPPISALPQGTDIDAFAQRMEDFQESSY